MKVKFWGVRGSIPTPLQPEQVAHKSRELLLESLKHNLKSSKDVDAFLQTLQPSQYSTYGGNSSCVEVNCDKDQIIFDAGSGLRELGVQQLKQDDRRRRHLFLSHTHWDHICGLPFYVEAYKPSSDIHIYSPSSLVQEHLANQHLEPNFPVTFKTLAGIRGYNKLEVNKAHEFNGIKVTPFNLDHPGEAFGYRLDYQGKSVIYATDSEFRNITEQDLKEYNPYQDCDLLIFDAMYTFEDVVNRVDWGHGSAYVGVDLCAQYNIRSMAIFHHEPTYDDKKLETNLEHVKEYRDTTYPQSDFKIFLAQEGLEIEL
jgi:phosphoribosyl 1,2-cyclic phosphodiesterase